MWKSFVLELHDEGSKFAGEGMPEPPLCVQNFWLNQRLFDLFPSSVGVIIVYLCCDFVGVCSEVFFMNGAALRHNKGHYAARSILGRIRDEGESAGVFEHAVVVTVVGRGLSGGVVAFLARLRKHRARRAW